MTATIPELNLLDGSTSIEPAVVEPKADADSVLKRDNAVIGELSFVQKALRVLSQSFKRGANLVWALTLIILILAMYLKNVVLEKNLINATSQIDWLRTTHLYDSSFAGNQDFRYPSGDLRYDDYLTKICDSVLDAELSFAFVKSGQSNRSSKDSLHCHSVPTQIRSLKIYYIPGDPILQGL